MAKSYARQFYNSTAWKSCREAYKHKVGYLCERCGEPGVVVHHKNRVSPETINDPSVLLDFNNLELLCMRCHYKEHAAEIKGKEKKSWQRYTFGENGEIILK